MTSIDKLEDSVEIAAPARRVWELVSDVRRMPEWSPQVQSVRLRSGFDAVTLGAQFTNLNKHGDFEWVTHGEIVRYDDGRELAFRIAENTVVWYFALEPLDDGRTLLREWRETPEGISDLARSTVDKYLGGHQDFTVALRKGIRQTLGAIKTAAETA